MLRGDAAVGAPPKEGPWEVVPSGNSLSSGAQGVEAPINTETRLSGTPELCCEQLAHGSREEVDISAAGGGDATQGDDHL